MLKVGVHAFDFVATTDEQAIDSLYPGWSFMADNMARERGGPPASRARYLSEVAPNGALLIGSPSSVAAKARTASEALGGIDRLTFQMSMAANDHQAQLQAIDLLGREVVPLLRNDGPA